MARKLAHNEESREEAPPDGRRRSGLTRRAYVRLGATATAAVASLTGWLGSVAGTRPEEETHRVRIRGSGTAATYEITAEGTLVPGAEASNDAESRISGRTAEGVVVTGTRDYRFHGALTSVRVDGDADVSVDGVAVDA